MIVLVLILVMVALVLMALLWIGALWIQGYIYNEAAESMHWRGVAAGAIITVLFAGWCFLNYRDPGAYDPLFNFNPNTTKQYDTIVSVKRVGEETQRTTYTLHKAGHTSQYRDSLNRPWKRSDPDGIVEAIEVEEDGRTIRFLAELKDVPLPVEKDSQTPNEKDKSPAERVMTKQFKTIPARYVEEGGRRVMAENTNFIVETTRWGVVLLYILLNVLHLALWLVCMWLILRFQFSHALGLAFVFWLAFTVIILPMLLDQARVLGEEKGTPTGPVAQVEARMCMISPSCTI